MRARNKGINLLESSGIYTYLKTRKQVLLLSLRKTMKTLGDRAFTDTASSLWNKLPSEIRDEDKFERFKSKLKTFSVGAAYPMESS